jgi:hypothetical protein
MTTAVIGSTGRVGSEIVRGLPARGDAVRRASGVVTGGQRHSSHGRGGWFDKIERGTIRGPEKITIQHRIPARGHTPTPAPDDPTPTRKATNGQVAQWRMRGHAMFTDAYHLRVARPDERARVQEIEDLAGTRFSVWTSSTNRATSGSRPPIWPDCSPPGRSGSPATPPTRRSAW